MNIIFKVIGALALYCVILPSAQAIHDYPADEFWVATNESNQSTIDHSLWQETLDEFLQTETSSGINLVDYAQLKTQGRKRLDSYVTKMSAVKVRDHNKGEQFAYWVNLYNAVTVKLIVDNYPVESIKKIGGWFSLGPWDDELVTVEGKKLSLNDIEHRILRPIWKDYRIHFVVNCASLGCPNLHGEALTADNSEKILDTAAKEFIRHSRGAAVNDSSVTLSKIFKWYQEDFGSSESEVIELLAGYLKDDDQALLKQNAGQVGYDYNWDLNDTK